LKNNVLRILKSSREYISGEEISKEFHMTRAAIWKHIKSLREEGYNIESVPSKGYRLISSPDLLIQEEIEEYLSTDFIGRNIIHYDSIGSTNKDAKEVASTSREGTVIIAEEQTEGRGRMGRAWASPKAKGIWMTIVLKPKIEPMKVARLTLLGAAAVFNALGELNVKPQIKWPNDLLLDGKKICGILTEMGAELNMVNYVVMGIGVNVNFDEEDIPEEIKDRATSIKIYKSVEIDRKELTANILNEFEKLYVKFCETGEMGDSIKICRENSIFLGEEVRIIRGDEVRLGKAVDIDENGQLVVEFSDNNIESIYSGEVSLRGINPA